MSDNLEIPIWRRAVRMFLEEQFPANTIVEHDWLFDAFAIDRPTGTTPKEQADVAQFEFLSAFKKFSEQLLVEHKIALDQVRSVGYRVVPTPEQVTWAEDEGRKQIKKAIDKRALRIAYTDTAQLDSAGRQQRSDAIARTGRLRKAMLGDSKRIVDIDSFRSLVS